MALEENRKLLKAKGTTNVGKLAGSICASYEESQVVPIVVRVIGAGALNQAVKAIILSNKQFVKRGKLVTILPSFNSFEDGITSVELALKVNVL